MARNQDLRSLVGNGFRCLDSGALGGVQAFRIGYDFIGRRFRVVEQELTRPAEAGINRRIETGSL